MSGLEFTREELIQISIGQMAGGASVQTTTEMSKQKRLASQALFYLKQNDQLKKDMLNLLPIAHCAVEDALNYNTVNYGKPPVPGTLDPTHVAAKAMKAWEVQMSLLEVRDMYYVRYPNGKLTRDEDEMKSDLNECEELVSGYTWEKVRVEIHSTDTPDKKAGE